VTSSWFFILQLSQDARSNKHQITYIIYYALSQNVCLILYRQYNHKKPVIVDSLQTQI